MARHSLWNCRRAERAWPGRAAMLLLCCALCACASGAGNRPSLAAQFTDGRDASAHYLLALREYLALPAGGQHAHRERLRIAAEREGTAAEIEYALALSVDRDDRASLEAAIDYFERLLRAPDPLPVALDALVRMQLGQAMDRLQRMRESQDMHDAYRAAAIGQQTCHAELIETRTQLADMRADLAEVRRKLDALARIEQTVDKSQETRQTRRLPPRPSENDQPEENNDAGRTTDTARR